MDSCDKGVLQRKEATDRTGSAALRSDAWLDHSRQRTEQSSCGTRALWVVVVTTRGRALLCRKRVREAVLQQETARSRCLRCTGGRGGVRMARMRVGNQTRPSDGSCAALPALPLSVVNDSAQSCSRAAGQACRVIGNP